MKLSVFARGSNPAIHRHIQRKSESYCLAEVEALRADWVDKADRSKGIICREFLYFGERLVVAAPESVEKLARPRPCPLPPAEIGFTRFDDPEKTLTKRLERNRLLVSARAIAYFGRPLEFVYQLESA